MTLTGESPFKDVLVNGMVQGENKKKMSKSLGNYVEAKDVIAKYGSDALRQWAALGGSTGKDIAYSPKEVERAKSFLVKLWNASKFVEKLDAPEEEAEGLSVSDKWVLSRLNKTKASVTEAMKNYDFYSAITGLYEFFWHDYCDFYLEDIKYRVYGEENRTKKAAAFTAKTVLRDVLKMLAPFAPFTTDEIHYHLFSKESIHLQEWPLQDEKRIDENAEKIGGLLHEAVTQIRRLKADKNLSLGAELDFIKISASDSVCRELGEVEEDLKGIGKVKIIEFSPIPNAGNEAIGVSTG